MMMFVAGLTSLLAVLSFIFWGPALLVVDGGQVPVDLAIADHPTLQPGVLEDDALIVAVTRDGTVFLRDSRIGIDALTEKIFSLVSTRPRRKTYLKADARAKYSDVERVLDALRATGVRNVTLLTEQAPTRSQRQR